VHINIIVCDKKRTINIVVIILYKSILFIVAIHSDSPGVGRVGDGDGGALLQTAKEDEQYNIIMLARL